MKSIVLATVSIVALIAATPFIHRQHHHTKNQAGVVATDCNGSQCTNPSEPLSLELKPDCSGGSGC
jgi:hypothetical protein